jgi:nucleotide-binding universal stress UspA family protein
MLSAPIVSRSRAHRLAEDTPRPIVLATDGSDATRSAVEHAAAIAIRAGAQLYVFHVESEWWSRRPEGAHPGVIATLERAQISADEEAAHGRSPRSRLLVTLARTHSGHAAHEIAEFAREKDADLIVAGAHHRGPFRTNVAEELAREALCPVLIVPRSASRTPGAPLARRAIGLVDGSEASVAAVRATARLLDLAEVDAVHVTFRWRGPSGGFDTPRAALERLRLQDGLEEILEQDGKHLGTFFKTTNRPTQVLEEIRRRGSHDVVCCAGDAAGARDHVGERVLHAAPGPVLLVPPGVAGRVLSDRPRAATSQHPGG